MVAIPFHRCVQRFAIGKVAAAHQPPLLEVAQVAVDRCQAHGSWSISQVAMQLLTAHLIIAGLQGIQQLFLARIHPK